MSTPSPIDQLRASLSATVQSLSKLDWGKVGAETRKMQQTVERIRQQFGERPTTPPSARICAALSKLRSLGEASLDGRDFYFLCWGLTERCGNHLPLIEDARHFPAMFSEIQRRKPRTLLWQGLLDAYFRYEATGINPDGEQYWKLLRMWLRQDLNKLSQRNPEIAALLPWIQVLDDNRNLLTDRPCQSYAEAALNGDLTKIERITADLGIPPRSWFWRKLLFSQIETATGWNDDARFKQVLDNLLAQLAAHPVLRDEGLAKLLTRYASCLDKSVHEGLKRLAVEAWGSPQLVQQAKWGLVAPQVKEMVSQWLVLEDLEDFFERLQADGHADKRRLVFWKRFIKQISFSHVALSNHLWWSPQPNWVEFKQKKSGRISRLDGGGGSKNAFIMKIAGYYFIEFGETGDACYGYTVGHEPFSLGTGLLNYPKDLKDKDHCIFWGSHSGDHWEQRFLEGSDSWPGLLNLGVHP